MNQNQDDIYFFSDDEDNDSQNDNQEELQFEAETSPLENDKLNAFSQQDTWEVFIIDDEEDVHQLTRFVLEDFIYQEKKLTFFSAYSAEEAKALFLKHPNPAVVLLDVVMETNDAGLQLVEYIRNALKNPFTRIILRTGQPGYAPEKQVILKYDINDYKNKTELTDQKLFTIMISSLRAYADLMTIESFRQHLEDKVAARTCELQEKNEELVKLNQNLTDLNQEKNEFLGIVAHDLKNPLSSIQSLANLIRTSADEFPKEKISEFAQMIEASSQKMFNLIKNLLDVNAIESGKINFSLILVDIRFFIQSLVKNYVQTAKNKNIQLHYACPDEKFLILADQMAILQVLDNLISNAIKYTLQGKNVYIRLQKDNSHVRCEIQDEGPGLSEKDLSKLFGKFARLTPRPTANEHSTGLCLFIVKKLVSAMNGSVRCESELGKGSTFIVEFPHAHQ
jgi:signal transduction histidine kinase